MSHELELIYMDVNYECNIVGLLHKWFHNRFVIDCSTDEHLSSELGWIPVLLLQSLHLFNISLVL